jgi:GMP synthase (glutamine-hydrolysing)
VVRRISKDSGFDQTVWQFPVILIPLGSGDRPDSVVLRPIESVDGMTANAVRMDSQILGEMIDALKTVEGIATVFYDVTNKPPATIEWE